MIQLLVRRRIRRLQTLLLLHMVPALQTVICIQNNRRSTPQLRMQVKLGNWFLPMKLYQTTPKLWLRIAIIQQPQLIGQNTLVPIIRLHALRNVRS